MNSNSNIQITIDGVSHDATAYQIAGGILIHLPGISLPEAPLFETLFQSLPDDRLLGGFIEVGDWDGKGYAFEGDVLFGLGPDGAVWGKICDHPDELPLAENVPGNTALAWRMLAEAEEAFGAKSMALERSACGGWPTPRSVADFLMWLEDEAEIQQQQSADHPDEMTERLVYAAALSELAAELRGLSFEPSTPPWDAEALQEGEA